MAGYDVSSDRQTDRLLSPAVFPKTRSCLWDKTNVGQPVLLHINHYRKPRVCIPEKILKLVQHQCENYGRSKHMLIGTLVVDVDEEGVQVQVDRLDTRLDVPGSSLDMPIGNVLICLQVTNNTANGRTASVDDYVHALKNLQSRCCSKKSIDLCGFFHIYGWGCFYSNAHTSLVHLDFDMITLGTVFKATPITPVPILGTALSKNLASPNSLSSLQGTPNTGYLTMDPTRKLLLVFESDPKTSVLPIIGIWVSGVKFIHHPFVWASCLRYIHNTHLPDRVCMPPEEFLLVLYTQPHSRLEFYQCKTSSGNTSLEYELNSGHEVINMDKMLSSPGSGHFVEVDMEPVCSGNKMEVFDEAQVKLRTCIDVRDGDVSGQEDLEPRCAPKPHSEKVPVFHPSVPDVSVLWTELPENVFCPDMRQGKSSDELQGLTPDSVFSRPDSTARTRFPHVNMVSPTGDQQHAKYHPQIRPLLSQQYSPSGQTGQCLPPSVSRPLRPVLHGQWSPAAAHDTLSITQSSTSNPESPCRPLVPQPSPVTSSRPVCHSSKLSVRYSTAGASPHQQLGTPTVTHAQNCRPNFISPISQQLNSRINQHSNNSQSAVSLSPRPGQCHAITPGSVSLPASSHLHSNMQLPALTASHHTHTSSSRDCMPQRTSLRTITEEMSSSLSIENTREHLDQKSVSANVLELTDEEVKCQESSGSPFSHHSINSSGRSTGIDSGLGVTPDRLSISVPQRGTNSLVPAVSLSPISGDAPAAAVVQPQMDNIKWEQIPPEVRSLFIQQNEQLRQLQQQIQILQSQQLAQSKQVSSPHEATDSKKYCSVAVNTSVWSGQNNQKLYDCKSAEVTPTRAVIQQDEFRSHGACSRKPAIANTVNSPWEGCKQCLNHDNTVMSVSNVDRVAQGPPDSFLEDVSLEDLDRATAGMNLFEQTANTEMSDMVVDIHEYASSVNDRSQSDENLSSVSDYARQTQEDLNSSVGDDAADPRQFYGQLLKNIHMLLARNGSQDSRTSILDIIQAEPAQQVSTTRFESPACAMTVPEVGSVSMLLDNGTDTGQSMMVNALAMKYLSDDQLTQTAKFNQSAPCSSHGSAYSAKTLQHVISGYKFSASLASDMSHFGLSPSNMTIGTQMYLEKYGLQGNDGSVLEMPAAELKLRTDFSILTSEITGFSLCEPHHLGDVNQNDSHSQVPASMSHPPIMGPVTDVGPALLPKALETDDCMNNENWLPDDRRITCAHKDLCASPILPSCNDRKLIGYADRGQNIIHQNKRHVLQEVKPQMNHRMGHNNSLVENSTDEDIPDIEMLKKLPKFL